VELIYKEFSASYLCEVAAGARLPVVVMFALYDIIHDDKRLL